MNNREQKQQEALHMAFDNAANGKELSDEALDSITGGTVIIGPFYLCKCNLCDWHATFDDKGEDDIKIAVLDHIKNKPNCKNNGDNFSVFYYNKPSAT